MWWLGLILTSHCQQSRYKLIGVRSIDTAKLGGSSVRLVDADGRLYGDGVGASPCT